MASFTLENRSGYDTADLRAFFRVALARCGVRTHKQILVVASPIRTRGCAEVASDRPGSGIVVAIAPPSTFTMSKFSRIVLHELTHAKGVEHDAMPERLLYSEGSALPWTKGLRIRYRGRAPDQMLRLRPARAGGARASRDVAPANDRARAGAGAARSFDAYLRAVAVLIASVARLDARRAARLAARWRSVVRRFHEQGRPALFAADHVVKYEARGLCPCSAGSSRSCSRCVARSSRRR